MNTFFSYTAPVLLSVLLFFSCTKTDNPDTPETTALEITVKDENGQPVTKNCSVKLYDNIEEWAKDSLDLFDIGDPKFPDAQGKVLFSDLNPQKYYWRIESFGNDCYKNNFNDTYPDMGLSNPLAKGTKMQVTSGITPKGGYSIQNSTNSTYRLYVNGVFAADIIQNGSYSKVHQKIQTYTIRMLQTTGVTGTPIDSTFAMQVQCGVTTQVFFNP